MPVERQRNRLASETSPYLLQHASNPVDWYPWGAEALERARREDKPILLSIGYAACHWCHVMERESFENEAIARQMNEHFVCIKVDREERPDLDEIYMTATIAMSGSGGWPMTVFLTPDQRPFFAGTYFPPSDAYGRPGFGSLLERIAGMWQNDRSALLDQAKELTEHVRLHSKPTRPIAVSEDAVAGAVTSLEASFDARFGGFGGAPKFPPAASLSLLLREHRKTGRSKLLDMVVRTLDGMKSGGIYDHLGGGFARYSTDERWLVPHFEKMLYDNAQLARVYLEAWQVTKNPEYERVARETLDYALREMQSPDGGFYSAIDADSDGEEGKFYVWMPDEVTAVLGPETAEAFCAYYDVTEAGNWEGKNVLHTPQRLAEVAHRLDTTPEALDATLRRAREQMAEARKQRTAPALDDKVLTAWTALMLGSLAEGYRLLRDRRYLDAAERAARFVLSGLVREDGGLFRTARAGHAHLPAYLEDYAFLVDGLLDLYEASGEAEHLRHAERLADRMIADFVDPELGGFFQTSRDHETLLVRRREGTDSALPSANAVAARALARLAHQLDRPAWRELAVQAIRAFGAQIEHAPRAFVTSLCVADFLLEPPIELVFAGHPASAEHEALCQVVAEVYLPNRVIAHATGDDGARPLTAEKRPIHGQAALYVCRDFTCRAPVLTPDDVRREIEATERQALTLRLTEVAGKPLPGHATPRATARLAENYAKLYGTSGYAAFGDTGLSVSRLGFGGYRIDESRPEHREALRKALHEGCNLIDTSSNYSAGSSERLIGAVLGQLVSSGEVRREEVVVVSKVGYLQGAALERARRREREGRPYPEVVKVSDDLWHCIHPEWIDQELARSLERLGLETLDVCLLHNPEYFLTHAARSGAASPQSDREELYRRMQAAFTRLEEHVQRGRLRYYGVSSNTAAAPAGDPEATDLARMLQAAELAAPGRHHFRVLELPFNLIESAAALDANTDGGGRTVLEQALGNGVAVLANRPLNAIVGDALLRLAQPPALEPGPEFEPQRTRVATIEQAFRTKFAPLLRAAPGGVPPEELLDWSEKLRELPKRLQSYEQYTEIEAQVIAPRVSRVFEVLDRSLKGAIGAEWRKLRATYLTELEALLKTLRRIAAERSRERLGRLIAALDQTLPAERRAEPLSRKALWIPLSAPGVTAALVGMRRPEYVADALPVLGFEPHPDPDAALAAVRAAAAEQG